MGSGGTDDHDANDDQLRLGIRGWYSDIASHGPYLVAEMSRILWNSSLALYICITAAGIFERSSMSHNEYSESSSQYTLLSCNVFVLYLYGDSDTERMTDRPDSAVIAEWATWRRSIAYCASVPGSSNRE